MPKISREEKLQKMIEFLKSEEHTIISEELDKAIRYRDELLKGFAESGECNKTFFNMGYKQGLIEAKNIPQKIKDDNKRMLDKIRELAGLVDI